MEINNQQFEELVSQALNSLPDKFKIKLNNLAIFVDDYPTVEQLKKIKLQRGDSLYGLFEGYCQAKALNFGAVLPDRITIFRLAIAKSCANFQEIKEKITSTVRHEIAHHFGSNEKGANQAGRCCK
ncbi:MAG: metallopeptidase family protein [Patescibacteria group bacterium]|nr:metallopeptidase family protein [Patescibacteria group bacterium]MBU1870940.1 metallopeptidase family protein [Patescibacteria group bacterium]